MINFEELTPIEFPQISKEARTNDELRHAIVKASAYITFALEEAGVNHERDLNAAFVTDATHTLEENCTPQEYLELAIQELAFAEGETENEDFASELGELRRELQEYST